VFLIPNQDTENLITNLGSGFKIEDPVSGTTKLIQVTHEFYEFDESGEETFIVNIAVTVYF
jgi:hypothetical protein